MPRIRLIPMEATYLAWLDVRELGIEQPDKYFEQHGVGLSNGAFFGTPGFLRLNLGCPPKMLDCALERMEAAYHKLS
jgi:cystathionine beta-lyase